MTTITITEITASQMHHARLKKATALDGILRAEYPALRFEADTNEDESRVVLLRVHAETEEGTTEVLFEGEGVPDLADLLEAAEDLGIDPETGADEEDEDKSSGSVVDEAYRRRYAETSSTGQSCGDWLAEQLANDTIGADGFRPGDFQAVLDNNRVDQTGAWAKLPESGQKGWVGRWRMNGRQILEKAILLSGTYIDPVGRGIEPEASWLAAMERKHEKWLDKQRKLEAALKQDVA